MNTNRLTFLYAAVCLMFSNFAVASGLTLDELISLTLQASPTVRAAESTVLGDAAAIEKSKWKRFPSFSLQGDNRISGSGNYPFTGTEASSTFKVSLPLWTAGRITSEIDAATLRHVSAQFAVEETKEQVALRTVSSWRSLIGASGTIRADERALERLSNLAEKILRRVTAGVSAPVDIESVRARQLQMVSDRSAAFSQLQVAVSRLLLQAGHPGGLNLPQDLEDIEQQVREAEVANALPDDTQIMEFAATSPSYKKALTDSKVASLEALGARAALFPEISATYQYQPAGGGLPVSEGLYLSLSYQPGGGLTALSQIEEAASHYENLLYVSDNALLDAREAILADIQEYSDAKIRTQQTEEAVNKSNEVLDSSLRLFDSGRRSVFEILSAVNEISQNERALAPLRAQLIASHYNLCIRLGQLSWQTRQLIP